MHPGDIILLIGVSTVAAGTLIGVTALAVRVVFAPVLKARRLAAQAQSPPPDAARLDARMDSLEEEMRQMGETMNRVAAALEFDAQLRSGAG